MNTNNNAASTNILILLFLVLSLVGRSADLLDTWIWRNPLPTGNTLNGAAYGNGAYVLVGSGGTILASPDGSNWTRSVSGTSAYLSGVAFAAGQFVAVGQGTVLTSPDGRTWTSRAVTATTSFWKVAYGAGRFVAVGSDGVVARSTNGVVWHEGTAGVAANLFGIACDSGLFVAVGSSGTIRTSPDGVTWTPRSSGTGRTLRDVGFGNGLFVAAGVVGTLLTSPDGITWTARPSGSTALLFSTSYGAGRFVTVATLSNTILTSPDGIDWTPASFPAISAANGGRGVTYGNGQFVAAGDYGAIATSPDGTNWTGRSSGWATDLFGVAHGNELFVVVGSSLRTSPDGRTWTERVAETGTNLLGICRAQNLFVAVGDGGRILTSSDGIAWTPRVSGTTWSLSSVAFGARRFVSIGNQFGTPQHTILTSSNGINWSVGPTASGWFNGLSYGNGLFVAAGPFGGLQTSSNGVTWNLRASATTEDLWSVAFGNGQFVAVGGNATVVTSRDGVIWARRQIPPGPYWLRSAAFGHGLYVTAGYWNGDFTDQSPIFTSLDGTNWTLRASGAVPSLDGLGYANGRFIAVGFGGAILECDIRPRLGPTTLRAAGVAQISLAGISGQSYSIEASTTLTNWDALTSVVATNGSATFTDSLVTNSPQRFYRAASRP